MNHLLSSSFVYWTPGSSENENDKTKEVQEGNCVPKEVIANIDAYCLDIQEDFLLENLQGSELLSFIGSMMERHTHRNTAAHSTHLCLVVYWFELYPFLLCSIW